MSAPAGKPQAPHTPAYTRGDLSWRDRAHCHSMPPERFFPHKSDAQKDIIKVCLSCAVRLDCLQYALDADCAYGVWGGTTQEERKKLKRKIGVA